jgi:PKD repeat protein
MKKVFPFILFLFISIESRSQAYIIGYEYWCDTAISARVYVPVPPQQEFTLDTLIGFPGLPKGLHMLNIRFQQNNFYWSNAVTEYFFKTGEGNSANGNINAFRYWVDGLDSVVTQTLATPVHMYDLVTTIDLSWVNRGANTLHMQFGDEAGNWSVAIVDSFFKSSIPAAAFETDDTLICGPDSVHFRNLSNDADIYTWYFGDGDSSYSENPVHYYQLPGSYTVTLLAADTTSGTDSTMTIIDFVVIHRAAHASFTMVQTGANVEFTNTSTDATGYSWDFGDGNVSILKNPVHTYLFDGNYTVVLTAFDSCGSVTDTQFVSITLQTAENPYTANFSVIQNGENLILNFNVPLRNSFYVLTNTSGQMLRKRELSFSGSNYTETISIEDFRTGIYYLSLYSSEGNFIRKIFIGY